jgi:ADP-heptose:LPS heptosyltransferase
VKRILVVELWNIGDVVLTLPFLAQLRAIVPDAEITLLARPYASEILAGTGLVDRFVEAELTWQTEGRSLNPFNYDWAELLRVVHKLREQKFDLAFQCRPHVREYVLLALSGARRRIGYARPGWDRGLTDAIAFGDSDVQKKDAWLRLLEPFGGPGEIDAPSLSVSRDEQLWATEFLRTNGADPANLLVAVHPGASVPEKRWPIERFEEVANYFGARDNVDVLALIEPSGYGTSLAGVGGAISAKVELRQMIALLAECDLLVCNDSGPMHIAAALGVPTVAIFGSGITRLFAPLGDQHEAVTAGLGAGPAAGPASQAATPSGPYDDVAYVPVSKVLEAAERGLLRAATTGDREQQARILLSHGRR